MSNVCFVIYRQIASSSSLFMAVQISAEACVPPSVALVCHRTIQPDALVLGAAVGLGAELPEAHVSAVHHEDASHAVSFFVAAYKRLLSLRQGQVHPMRRRVQYRS